MRRVKDQKLEGAMCNRCTKSAVGVAGEWWESKMALTQEMEDLGWFFGKSQTPQQNTNTDFTCCVECMAEYEWEPPS